MAITTFVLAAYFSLLILLEILSALGVFGLEGGTLMNAFALGTIAAIYLKRPDREKRIV